MKTTIVAICMTSLLSLPGSVLAIDIAGVEPDKRPVNAPVQQEVNRDNVWYKKQLHGVTSPYPKSLRFLELQGRWYTPFSQPGMPGRYNIRNW